VRHLLGLAGLVAFVGWALVLSGMPWFRRRPLVERVAAYVPGGVQQRPRSGLLSAVSWRELVEPLARIVGERLSRVFGVTEPLAVRLERVHAPCGPTEFRVRQLGWVGLGFGVGSLVAVGVRAPGIVAVLLVIGGPLLAFLVVEQQLASASDRWKRHLVLELPVVAEQLGMLLGAGYSLSSALDRLARRGKGACGRDLGRVVERMRLGLSDVAALREWAAVADVLALHRLVGVLALNRQAGDLGRLIGEEARSIRRDVHRDLIETIERRAQQVWVPVTVATLVPGMIFLAVPFVEALRLFSNA
jgi:Flp pilus assembly protein TadB